jgi:hypothetical protein
VSLPPLDTLGAEQSPAPDVVRIRSLAPMQVRTVLVPLPAPMVVISQSPGFRFGISSAAAIAVRERPGGAGGRRQNDECSHAILLEIVERSLLRHPLCHGRSRWERLSAAIGDTQSWPAVN